MLASTPQSFAQLPEKQKAGKFHLKYAQHLGM